MRLPRVRFTVRRMMIAVAILCVGLRMAPEILQSMISNTRGHAPLWMVPLVSERVRRLTPGMTAPSVWEELGLYRRVLDGGVGGGPRNHNWSHYTLRPGCGITLVFDYTARPPRLVSARLVGNGCSN
jgi:hypothetical protein